MTAPPWNGVFLVLMGLALALVVYPQMRGLRRRQVDGVSAGRLIALAFGAPILFAEGVIILVTRW